MNNARRKKIEILISWLVQLEDDFDEGWLNKCISMLEDIKGEEEEAFENMPEGLQYSARGMDSEAAIENMDEAWSCLDDACTAEDEEERLDSIDMAIDCLEDAKV